MTRFLKVHVMRLETSWKVDQRVVGLEKTSLVCMIWYI